MKEQSFLLIQYDSSSIIVNKYHLEQYQFQRRPIYSTILFLAPLDAITYVQIWHVQDLDKTILSKECLALDFL